MSDMYKKFFASYSGIRQENWFYRVICGVLVVANLILGIAVLSRKELVVLVPPGLKQETKVGQSVGDRHYQEDWGLFFALLVGNITPRNVGFVVEEMEKFLAPTVYHDLIKDIYEQAKGIKESNVSTTFEPRELTYDDKTGHVLVKGQMVMRGSYGKPQSVGKTFEFGIVVRNYSPQITYMAAYSQKPREEQADAKKTSNQKDQGKND
jgi:conjugal transfer pilus assembly protein TraE